jgi:C-terminal processing protease CtpA/Prc
MFHTGLHDQYHRPSDDVQLINFDGIEPVARLTLDFVNALANDPGPARQFRSQSRSETDATKRALESPAVSQGTPAQSQGTPAQSQGTPAQNVRPRWGIGTRTDPGEPANPVIVRITAGSPAARASMMPGDRVLAIDGTAVTDQADMVTRLANAGSHVAIDIDRKGKIVRIDMDATQP